MGKLIKTKLKSMLIFLEIMKSYKKMVKSYFQKHINQTKTYK
jgi:hypothetical protein